jgi:hypothetical protein
VLAAARRSRALAVRVLRPPVIAGHAGDGHPNGLGARGHNVEITHYVELSHVLRVFYIRVVQSFQDH